MATIQQGFLKRSSLLLGALGLLGLSGALMMKPGAQRERRPELEFPRYPREHDLERQRRRTTLLRPQSPDGAAAPEVKAPRHVPAQAAEEPGAVRIDPLHVALSGAPLGLVVEAAALKDSSLGRMLLGCFTPQLSRELAELAQKTGVNPLEQVERIAIAGDLEAPVVILGGEVGGFDPAALGEGVSFEPQGEDTLWAEHGDQAVALWQDQMLLVGEPAPLRAVLQRLQGAASAGGEGLAAEAYGELYGSLSGRGASELLPFDLRERFAAAAERVTLHVDAREDLLLVAEVHGAQQPLLSDLATAIGGAFALGRLHAVRADNPVLAELLDQSRVIPGEGSFQVEMALPVAVLAEQLGACAQDALREP